VAKLAPTGEEVASLWIREADALRHANEAEEKLAALAERARLDATEIEWIQKEQDELLQTMAGLRAERDRNVPMPIGRSTTSWARFRRRGSQR
jgi:hypothetical protein